MSCDIIYNPIKFLGATVLSFNASLGLGSSSESSLNVDLIEDCEAGDAFMPVNDTIDVGAPVYFDLNPYGGAFLFGGVLNSWSVTQGGSGKTFNVKVVDPRQLLENTIVIVDSYNGPPLVGINYFNVYAGGEQDGFGESLSTERGMPYNKILQLLQTANPTIYPPTGQYQYYINWNSLPTTVPDFYRIAGPGISLLQLIQDVCDVSGYEFYVYLSPGNIINIGLINLKQPPSSFRYLLNTYNGIATELTFGEELRNEKTKAIMFGEQQHYLSYVNCFDFFFGEDVDNNGNFIPIFPFKRSEDGFWIHKKITSLNSTLFKPLPLNSYDISESDIRTAMSSYEHWIDRTMDSVTKGSFNSAIRNNWVECNSEFDQSLNDLLENSNVHSTNKWKAYVDATHNPKNAGAERSKPKFAMDLEKVHSFIAEIGNTYYGKQFIGQLNQNISYKDGENFQERIYSDVPTGAGGWVDGDVPVLGLSEPELSTFREDDYRIGCFALFNVSGDFGDEEDKGKVDPEAS